MAGRGPVAFALVFVALPLVGILGALMVGGGAAVGLAMASVALLLLGFTAGLFLLE